MKPVTEGSKDGVEVSKLQTGISIQSTKITGTSNYYKEREWSEGTWPENEQDGNYLVLELSSPNGGTVQTRVESGTHEEFITVSDGYCIYRLTNSATQKITVKNVTEKGENVVTYDLTGLTLTPDAVV